MLVGNRIQILLVVALLFRAAFGFHLIQPHHHHQAVPVVDHHHVGSNRQGYAITPRRSSTGSTTRLWYRELEVDDADTDAMLQIETRAPPGFDMKQNLAQNRAKPTAMNTPLIRALLLNQVLIVFAASVATAGALLFNEGFGVFSNLSEILHWGGEGGVDLSITPMNLLIGVAGAIPIVLFGNLVENSDNRDFANINFSTITMTMTLFGRRKAPPDAFMPPELKGKPFPTSNTLDVMIQSFVLSAVTGICEETVFRMEIPALINHFFGGYPIIPLLGQAVWFGLGHANANSNLKENGIVVGLQLINGTWFGVLYLLTGGDIISCMVAHAVYDFLVFFKTWLDSNSQIEYAQTMYEKALPSDVQSQVNQIMSKSRVLDNRRLSYAKKLFYTFDFDKNSSLSRSEVRKGISYVSLEKAGVPPPQAVVDNLFDTYTSETAKDRLSFPEFLRLYASTAKQ